MTYICIKCRTIWVNAIPVSIPGDCVKCALQTTLEIGKRARDFMIASKKRLNSVQERVVVTGCCATES
jgi:hypothetical protein